MRDKLLKEVESAILGRATLHGSPEDSFSLIAKYWSAFLALEITPRDAALMLALMKIARADINPNHMDNYVDGAGYMLLAGEVQTNAR